MKTWIIYLSIVIVLLIIISFIICNKDSKRDYDIIVIGTGISGLYFGWKCYKQCINKRILFIEQQNRVGGRISSAKLDPDEGYYAEGCAQRWFKGIDNRIEALLNELNIKSFPQRNDSVQTGKTYEKIYQNLKNDYPPDLNSNIYSDLSFPLELIKTNNYYYEAPLEFGKSIGYPLFQYPINLNMAYQTLERLTSPIQQLVEGGYQRVCDTIFNLIKNIYDFKFGYTVNQIENKQGGYLINGKITTKKLIFTGTINQLNIINTLAKNIQKIKIDVDRYYFNFNSIRMYVRFDQPWWRWEKDITKDSTDFYRWNSLSPFNQIEYYSENTILLYSSMEYAEMLLDLVPFRFRDREKVEWFDADNAPELMDFIKNILPQIIPIPNDGSINSMSKFAFKYRNDGAQFVKPIPEIRYEKFFNGIQESKNFYMLSGDYTKNPGWIEACLEIVDKKFKDIIN